MPYFGSSLHVTTPVTYSAGWLQPSRSWSSFNSSKCWWACSDDSLWCVICWINWFLSKKQKKRKYNITSLWIMFYIFCLKNQMYWTKACTNSITGICSVPDKWKVSKNSAVGIDLLEFLVDTRAVIKFWVTCSLVFTLMT